VSSSFRLTKGVTSRGKFRIVAIGCALSEVAKGLL